MKPSFLIAILSLFFAALAAGCATTPKENQDVTALNKDTTLAQNDREVTLQGEAGSQIDPYEDFNRPLYEFTDTVDRNVLEPVADSYIEHIPGPVRNSVGNFYDNLAYPNVILNVILQGKVLQGTEDGLRFVLNSTIGLAGLFDVATHMGLPKHNEDFGQTLGVWGVDNTSYMYLPILGPSSNRDVLSVPVTVASNILFYAGFVLGAPITIPLGILAIVDKRARHAEDIRLRDQAALDPYLFTREAYWQHRENLVFDGKPPIESYDDLFKHDLSNTHETSLYAEPCSEALLQYSPSTQQVWHPPLTQKENDNKQEEFDSSSKKDCSLSVHKTHSTQPSTLEEN